MYWNHEYKRRMQFDSLQRLADEYVAQEHPSSELVRQIDEAIIELKLPEKLLCPLCGKETDVLMLFSDPFKISYEGSRATNPYREYITQGPDYLCPECLGEAYDPDAPGIVSREGVWKLIREAWKSRHVENVPMPVGEKLLSFSPLRSNSASATPRYNP